MARGKNCPRCGHPMYAAKEVYEPAGTYVTYECKNGKTNCGFTEKLFEPK